MSGAPSFVAFLLASGESVEKRPRCEAHYARAATVVPLCVIAFLLLPLPLSPVGAILVIGTRVGFLLASVYNLAWGITLHRLRYTLEPASIAVRLGIQTLRIPYATITAADYRNAPWPIQKASILTYAKEVPQLIEYVAQVGAFRVAGRGKVYLYSTLSSYHDPKGLVLITTTDGKTYGISPAEPERFLEELKARCPQLAGT